MSPFKIIKVLSAILFVLVFADLFISENYKTELMVARLILAASIFVFAMLRSGAIEQEKIANEKAKAN
jgi:NADH:ubiquinone oxidoreductase subunit K